MIHHRRAADDDFRVLFVCTANKCRSPLAEYLLRDVIQKRWGAGVSDNWEISSAGVVARTGRPMDVNSLAVLQERGIDGSAFSSRRLTAAMVEQAHLVLAATREHRGQIAQLNPRTLGRLFTVNQFAYLVSRAEPIVETDPTAAGLALIAAAVAGRGQLPGRTTEDDTADPIGQPIGQFRLCAQTFDAALTKIVAPLPR